MVSQQLSPAVHAGEAQSSPTAGAPVDIIAVVTFSVESHESEAASLTELVIGNNWLRAGDVVYISETRRHTLTDGDLDAAARSVIGGVA